MVWIEFYLDLHNCPKTMGVFEFELIIYVNTLTPDVKPPPYISPLAVNTPVALCT